MPALEREYWEQDEFLFIPRFLPPAAVGALLDDVRRLEPGLNRNYIPRHKKGGSVSHYAIADEGPALLAFYRSERFRRFLERARAGRSQALPGRGSPCLRALLLHRARATTWAITTTRPTTGARATPCSSGSCRTPRAGSSAGCTRDSPAARRVDLAVATEPGSLVIFNGDKVYHGVSRLEEGERRVVYTMEYVTSQEMGRVQRLYSNLKDAFAYFGIRALLRGRGRARGPRARAESGS